MSDSERLDRLEREVAILRTEFARMRERLGVADAQPTSRPHAPPAPASKPFVPPPGPRAAAPSQGMKIEEMIGRYATVVGATITILAAVGVFLNWAIRSGALGP